MRTQSRVFEMIAKLDRQKQMLLSGKTGSTEYFELDESLPIVPAKTIIKRQPTVKKQYGKKARLQDICHNPDSTNYIPLDYCLKIGTDDQGNPVYW
jgi:hypothetical protein